MSASLRILLTGGSGQVGWELRRSLSMLGEVITPDRNAFDLSKPSTLDSVIERFGPTLIVNPAAYTAVDRAESEPDAAMQINRDAPAAIAESCKARGIGLVHFSTDYVYPGDGETPWAETARTGPVNVYGKSKLAGEDAVRSSGCDSMIFRTSWVYGARGSNFLLTMLRLGRDDRPLSIVGDQWGAPTPARLIAATVALILAKSLEKSRVSHFGAVRHRLINTGTYNLCAGGETSWHGFATEIFRIRQVMTGRAAPALSACASEDYRTPARRPFNSRLDLQSCESRFALRMPDWKQALESVMQDGAAPLCGDLLPG